MWEWEKSALPMIVPTLRVGMQPLTLCVIAVFNKAKVSEAGTRSVPGCIPTQSVGTIGVEAADSSR